MSIPDNLKKWRDSGRFIEHKGNQIFVHASGSAPEDSSIDGVFIVHGFPGSSWDWYGVVPRVAQDTRVVVFDMLGHGMTDKPADGDYSLFAQADRAEAVARDEGFRNVILVTHDMGQTVGSELMTRQEEGKLSFKIHHAIVHNGSTLVNLVHLNDLQKRLLGMPDEPLDHDLPPETFTEGLRGTFSKEHAASDETLDIMAAQILEKQGDRMMPRIIRYMKERQENLQRWTDGLTKFSSAPMSLYWGLQDPVSVEVMADTIKELRPFTDLHKWPDVGHWPPIEVPDRIAKAILDRLHG